MNANGNKMRAMFSIAVATVAMVLVCTLSASREPSSNTVLLDLVAFLNHFKVVLALEIRISVPLVFRIGPAFGTL